MWNAENEKYGKYCCVKTLVLAIFNFPILHSMCRPTCWDSALATGHISLLLALSVAIAFVGVYEFRVKVVLSHGSWMLTPALAHILNPNCYPIPLTLTLKTWLLIPEITDTHVSDSANFQVRQSAVTVNMAGGNRWWHSWVRAANHGCQLAFLDAE